MAGFALTYPWLNVGSTPAVVTPGYRLPFPFLGMSSGQGTTDVVTRTGGGKGARRRHRQFVNINGELIEVANRKEAEKLLSQFNKGKEKKPVKSKRITFKRGPYVSVYSVDVIKPKEVRASLASYYDEEESMLLMLLFAA